MSNLSSKTLDKTYLKKGMIEIVKKIASFQIDHTTLEPGIYLSRCDNDINTYDLRLKYPNRGNYLNNPAIHTFEHLFATYARNSEYEDKIIYFGPMGCRTGYYFLTKGITHQEVIKLIILAVKFIAEYNGEVPGVSEIECGNWEEHDLAQAKSDADEYLKIIHNWDEISLKY